MDGWTRGISAQDATLHVVVAQYVITAVPDPEAMLDEFARVLKPRRRDRSGNHLGAETGLRRTLERWFAPTARRLGWLNQCAFKHWLGWLNQCAFKHSLRNLPLNDSMKALSVGFPGREKSSVTPRPGSRVYNAREHSEWLRSFGQKTPVIIHTVHCSDSDRRNPSEQLH